MDNLSSERAIRVAACLLVGFSCIQACKWIMLSDGTSFTPSMLYLSRFSGVGAMGLLAILFFHRLPNSRRLFACAVGFVLAYAALSVLAAILAPGTIRIVVLHVAVVLYGIADGIFILLFLQLIALFEPRKSAAILVAIELLTNVFMLFLGMISGTALILVRFGLLTVGIALYFVAAKGLPDEALLDVHNAFKGAEPQSADPAEPHNTDGVSSSGAFPHTLSQWALFVVFAAVLFNIFGLVAQISSLSGNSFALYDLPTGIALVLLDALLLAFLIIRGGEIRFKPVAVLCGSLYVLSLVIYNYAWSAGN
ncbi:MAG: hypothetical protein IKF96_01030, partial [Eggerthellaceae bacterium]|nr:hypothetical protein [Eggerthellaceae bacterium]